MTSEHGPKRASISWWQLVLGIDLFLLLATIIKKYPLYFHGRQFLVRNFNLAAERNSAVWWSMACLLALSFIAYEIFSQQEGKGKAAWLVLSIVLAGLSLDEIASLHERTGGWNATRVIFGVLLAVLMTYPVVTLFRRDKSKSSPLLIASAFFVFACVALQEHLEHHFAFPEWSLGIRVGVEEGSELLGFFLLFWGIVPRRTGIAPDGLRAMIPNPFMMKNLGLLVLVGGLIHSLACITVPSLIDITRQGNPLVWYPAAVFFLLFSATCWRNLDPSRGKPGIEVCMSVFFLACSIGFVYRLPKLFGSLNALVSEEYLPSVFLFSIVAGLLVLSSGIKGHLSLNGRHFLGLLALPPLCLLNKSPEVLSLASGILAYLVFHVFGTLEPLGRATTDKVERGPYLA